MSTDAELHDILREHEGGLLAFARKAYEHGYRQGLASRPSAAASAPLPATAPEPAPPAPAPGPLFGTGPTETDDDVEVDEPEDDDDDKDVGIRPVRSSITVGGLVKKINRQFGLGRFAIEVLVVDPRSRRHLKRGVRLTHYLLEGE